MQWKLLRLRKEKGLTQVELAKVLNITAENYGQKERGDKQFRQDEMFILSDYFGKPFEDIFLPRNFGNTEIEGDKRAAT